MGVYNLGNAIAKAVGFQMATGGGLISGTGFPKSGTTGGGIIHGVSRASTGTIYVDKSTGCTFVNEGTLASPYWTPTTYEQRGMMAWYADFRDGLGKANSDTAATATLTGSGLRVFGDQIVATDSGLVIATDQTGQIGTLQASATSSGNAALGFGLGGSPAGFYKPNTNGMFVVDAFVTQHTLKTLRSLFVGFTAAPIDALQSPATGATTVITYRAGAAGNDCVGLYADANLTDAYTNWFNIHDNAGGTATITTVAAVTGKAVAAVDVFDRVRVEVDADGGSRLFVNKLIAATNAAATNAITVAMSPVIVIQSTTAAVKPMLVKQFATWGVRA